jgi:hypothetical protein
LFQLRAEKDYRLLFPSPDDFRVLISHLVSCIISNVPRQIYISEKNIDLYTLYILFDFIFFDIFDIVFCYGYQLVDRIRALFNHHHHFKDNIKQIDDLI